MTPAASFALVTDASIIFEVPTELSASFGLVTEASAIFAVVIARLETVGFGYVPLRSPPADPLGGNVVGITPAASFALVTEASTIFDVVTELSASFVDVIARFAIVGLG